jgi:hypothetical protein
MLTTKNIGLFPGWLFQNTGLLASIKYCNVMIGGNDEDFNGEAIAGFTLNRFD